MLHLLLILIISGVSCTEIEQITVPIGKSFSFDCEIDESIFFAHRLNEWLEIQENDNQYISLNLNFDYLSKENILRVSSNAAKSGNHGYYGCRKRTPTSTEMNTIHQLIIADVRLFYWSYTCHAPVGSCIRTDNPIDETTSTLEIADGTNVDLYCCASVTGYKDPNINMNQVGNIRGNIHIHRKQELDDSWVVCATQHTLIKRASSKSRETLTCKLFVDKQLYSSLASEIVVKDAVSDDEDYDPSYENATPKTTGDSDHSTGEPSSANKQRKVTRGKRIAIIIGSVLGVLILVGLLLVLMRFLLRKRQDSTNENSNNRTNKKLKPYKEQNLRDDAGYLQPIPV